MLIKNIGTYSPRCRFSLLKKLIPLLCSLYGDTMQFAEETFASYTEPEGPVCFPKL